MQLTKYKHIKACAKLNLSLIFSKTRDSLGLHPLASLFCFLSDIYDVVCIGDGAQYGRYAMDRDRLHSILLDCSIIKHTPLGAGIGSLSACYAAAIKAQHTHPIPINNAEQIFNAYGYDTLLCLQNSMSFIDMNHKIAAVNVNYVFYVVLVVPKIYISTKEVFDYIETNNASLHDNHPSLLQAPNIRDSFQELISFINKTGNSLMDVVFKIDKNMGHAFDFLSACMGKAQYIGMSGSGSSFFAVYNDIHTAKEQTEKVSSLRPYWFVRMSRVY